MQSHPASMPYTVQVRCNLPAQCCNRLLLQRRATLRHFATANNLPASWFQQCWLGLKDPDPSAASWFQECWLRLKDSRDNLERCPLARFRDPRQERCAPIVLGVRHRTLGVFDQFSGIISFQMCGLLSQSEVWCICDSGYLVIRWTLDQTGFDICASCPWLFSPWSLRAGTWHQMTSREPI